MTNQLSKVLKNLKTIRKSKMRSKEDCAAIIGTSAETYHLIEEGQFPIFLPELELLSLFLNVELLSFFDDKLIFQPDQILATEKIRSRFIFLRNKMIIAAILAAQAKNNISLDEIASKSKIPVDVLSGYIFEEQAMPIDALQKITSSLNIDFESFLNPLQSFEKKQVDLAIASTQHLSGSKENNTPEISDEDYKNILAGFRRLIIDDQASIAKDILVKLKPLFHENE